MWASKRANLVYVTCVQSDLLSLQRKLSCPHSASIRVGTPSLRQLRGVCYSICEKWCVRFRSNPVKLFWGVGNALVLSLSYVF